MSPFSRREFGWRVIGAAPVALIARSIGLAAAPVAIGVSTSSFRDLPRVAGQDNVDRWRANGQRIPFSETRHYVERVEHLQTLYRRAYRSRLYGSS